MQPSGPPNIVWTIAATKQGTERLFPASKHRSARIHKKLVKRFGGEFRREPAIYRAGNTIYAHPAFREEYERGINAPPPPPDPKVARPFFWNNPFEVGGLWGDTLMLRQPRKFGGVVNLHNS